MFYFFKDFREVFASLEACPSDFLSRYCFKPIFTIFNKMDLISSITSISQDFQLKNPLNTTITVREIRYTSTTVGWHPISSGGQKSTVGFTKKGLQWNFV